MRLLYRIIDIYPKFHSVMDRPEAGLEIPYLAPNPAETVPRNYVAMGRFEGLFCGSCVLLQGGDYSLRDEWTTDHGSDATNAFRPRVCSQVIRHEGVKLAVNRGFECKGIYCRLGTQRTGHTKKKEKTKRRGGMITP
jgi:hypothetical protein